MIIKMWRVPALLKKFFLNAGLKNYPILATLLGHYGTEHALGGFDPAAGLDAFNPECWVDHFTHIPGENNYIAGFNLTLHWVIPGQASRSFTSVKFD